MKIYIAYGRLNIYCYCFYSIILLVIYYETILCKCMYKTSLLVKRHVKIWKITSFWNLEPKGLISEINGRNKSLDDIHPSL